MYHATRKCGVLTDFDCASLTRLPGTDRTGTIPFMDLELLRDQYWKGNITRRYHHDLEAFICMLLFVFLAYDDEKFDPHASSVKDWMTSGHNTCRESKSDFINFNSNIILALQFVQDAFKNYKLLMFSTCHMVRHLLWKAGCERDRPAFHTT